MVSFYDSLKALVNREMISNASATVEERDFNVSSAISSIIPGLLGVFLKNGNTPQIKNTLEEAGNLNILADIDRVSSENPTLEQQRIGDDFLQQLLGDKAADFTAPIAEKASISKVATNRLVSMITPVVSGFLGNKLVRENWTMDRLMLELKKERDRFVPFIPADLISSFGLSSVLNSDKVTPVEEKSKGGMGWLVWVLLAVALIVLFFWWRSCKDSDRDMDRNAAVVTDTISSAPADNDRQMNAMNDRTSMEFALPDSSKFQAYKGGVEEQMLKYLQSGDYKNAKDDDLKDKWFEFDNVAFEFGSSTELKPESKAQLNNIIAILKNYKDAKIKVAAFADKKGSEEANMKISQERAKTIENMLEKGGAGSQVVKIQGYGDEYAKHSASDSNEQRAEDRDIALRFVK
uniref:OmpA family protein n=1 Tax=Prevotella sp. 10(H) TaxID=1158294 RepID=UPI00068CDA93|nr:OmpA family protein [Prevotella sp. 10(H)]